MVCCLHQTPGSRSKVCFVQICSVRVGNMVVDGGKPSRSLSFLPQLAACLRAVSMHSCNHFVVA